MLLLLTLQIGPDNVTSVVMDNASNCKLAGEIVTARFPWITCAGCVPHAMDLALEDIGKEGWVNPTLKAAHDLVKFIANHHKSLALFRQQSSLELLKPGDTRFASSFITLDRLVELRAALEATFAGQEWGPWVATLSRAKQDLAADLKELVKILARLDCHLHCDSSCGKLDKRNVFCITLFQNQNAHKSNKHLCESALYCIRVD